MDHNDILKEKSNLNKERGYKLREFLHDYDSRIYNPAMKQLRENCKKIGHKYIARKYNIMGHIIYECYYCGVSKHEKM